MKNQNIDLEEELSIPEGSHLELKKDGNIFRIKVLLENREVNYEQGLFSVDSEYFIEKVGKNHVVQYSRGLGTWPIAVKESRKKAEDVIKSRFEKIKEKAKYFNPCHSVEAYLNSLV